jgi:hypothetical protein
VISGLVGEICRSNVLGAINVPGVSLLPSAHGRDHSAFSAALSSIQSDREYDRLTYSEELSSLKSRLSEVSMLRKELQQGLVFG